MTVAELIAELQKWEPSKQVRLYTGGGMAMAIQNVDFCHIRIEDKIDIAADIITDFPDRRKVMTVVLIESY